MYSASILEKVKNTPGTWESLKIGIFDENNKQIGEYIRNYHTLYRTFFPFKKNEKWYALYSKDYTSTRVMSLPDCRDLGGEDRNTWGFCPTDYYVPKYRKYTSSYIYKNKTKIYEETLYDKELKEEDTKEYNFITPLLYKDFGFVAGCVWGDDYSWKIQYLDLSQVEQGIIKRDDRFGYIHLPDAMNLEDCIQIEHESYLKITTTKHYNPKLLSNNDYDSPDYNDPNEE